MSRSARWRHLKDNWSVSSYYERFESAVALYRVGESVVAGLIFGI